MRSRHRPRPSAPEARDPEQDIGQKHLERQIDRRAQDGRHLGRLQKTPMASADRPRSHPIRRTSRLPSALITSEKSKGAGLTRPLPKYWLDSQRATRMKVRRPPEGRDDQVRPRPEQARGLKAGHHGHHAAKRQVPRTRSTQGTARHSAHGCPSWPACGPTSCIQRRPRAKRTAADGKIQHHHRPVAANVARRDGDRTDTLTSFHKATARAVRPVATSGQAAGFRGVGPRSEARSFWRARIKAVKLADQPVAWA